MVELHRMPLLMHQAWQEHAAALLREVMLVRLDAELSALEEHASASDALGLLLDQIPSPDVGMDPDTMMAHATEPEVSRRSDCLHRGAAGVAAELRRAGRDARRGAQPGRRRPAALAADPARDPGDAAVDLRPGPAPGGRRAAPARGRRSRPPCRRPTRSPTLGWDATEIAEATYAVLAADDANRIVAVSPSALELLGYDDAAAAGRSAAGLDHPRAVPPGPRRRLHPPPRQRPQPAARPPRHRAGPAPRRQRGPGRPAHRVARPSRGPVPVHRAVPALSYSPSAAAHPGEPLAAQPGGVVAPERVGVDQPAGDAAVVEDGDLEGRAGDPVGRSQEAALEGRPEAAGAVVVRVALEEHVGLAAVAGGSQRGLDEAGAEAGPLAATGTPRAGSAPARRPRASSSSTQPRSRATWPTTASASSATSSTSTRPDRPEVVHQVGDPAW